MCVKNIALFYTLEKGQSYADRSACTDRSVSDSKTFAKEVNS